MKYSFLLLMLIPGFVLAVDHTPSKTRKKITTNPEEYPYKNHVYKMMGISVESSLTPVGDYTIGFCFITDAKGKNFALDRTIVLDNVWLNGKKYEKDKNKRHRYTYGPNEILKWSEFAGPLKATETKDGGWNLESLEGEELEDRLIYLNKGKKWEHNPKIISSSFNFKVRTIDECRNMWVKEFIGEWKWNVEKGGYMEVEKEDIKKIP